MNALRPRRGSLGRRLNPEMRERRRLRLRRHGRRAYIRSVYSLPSLATLGNAVSGFAAMYISTLDPGSRDSLADYFARHHFLVAAYLIYLAMLFDAIDGRLARFARHTTDFGGQLDSLADAVSFGAAPAFLALQLFDDANTSASPIIGRMAWAIGALFVSCALLRLARFNVSNEHGEQHHFSFLGLPSPGAAGAVAALVLMQQDLAEHGAQTASALCVWLLPPVVFTTALLMVSTIRYPHLVNRYLRGKRSIGRLVAVLVALLALVVVHRYALCIGTIGYALWGLTSWVYVRTRSHERRAVTAKLSHPPDELDAMGHSTAPGH